jgi:hypothetical protein
MSSIEILSSNSLGGDAPTGVDESLLQCPICEELLKNPVMSRSCGHIFCYECITRVIEAGFTKEMHCLSDEGKKTLSKWKGRVHHKLIRFQCPVCLLPCPKLMLQDVPVLEAFMGTYFLLRAKLPLEEQQRATNTRRTKRLAVGPSTSNAQGVAASPAEPSSGKPPMPTTPPPLATSKVEVPLLEDTEELFPAPLSSSKSLLGHESSSRLLLGLSALQESTGAAGLASELLQPESLPPNLTKQQQEPPPTATSHHPSPSFHGRTPIHSASAGKTVSSQYLAPEDLADLRLPKSTVAVDRVQSQLPKSNRKREREGEGDLTPNRPPIREAWQFQPQLASQAGDTVVVEVKTLSPSKTPVWGPAPPLVSTTSFLRGNFAGLGGMSVVAPDQIPIPPVVGSATDDSSLLDSEGAVALLKLEPRLRSKSVEGTPTRPKTNDLPPQTTSPASAFTELRSPENSKGFRDYGLVKSKTPRWSPSPSSSARLMDSTFMEGQPLLLDTVDESTLFSSKAELSMLDPYPRLVPESTTLHPQPAGQVRTTAPTLGESASNLLMTRRLPVAENGDSTEVPDPRLKASAARSSSTATAEGQRQDFSSSSSASHASRSRSIPSPAASGTTLHPFDGRTPSMGNQLHSIRLLPDDGLLSTDVEKLRKLCKPLGALLIVPVSTGPGFGPLALKDMWHFCLPTHVVVASQDSREQRGSPATCEAVLLGGVWVVTLDWAMACLKQRRWLPEEPYSCSGTLHNATAFSISRLSINHRATPDGDRPIQGQAKKGDGGLRPSTITDLPVERSLFEVSVKGRHSSDAGGDNETEVDKPIVGSPPKANRLDWICHCLFVFPQSLMECSGVERHLVRTLRVGKAFAVVVPTALPERDGQSTLNDVVVEWLSTQTAAFLKRNRRGGANRSLQHVVLLEHNDCRVSSEVESKILNWISRNPSSLFGGERAVDPLPAPPQVVRRSCRWLQQVILRLEEMPFGHRTPQQTASAGVAVYSGQDTLARSSGVFKASLWAPSPRPH